MKYKPETSLTKPEQNDIIFTGNNGLEIMKLCPSGEIYIKGKLVTNDKEVVDAMAEFLGLKIK